jgi:RNA polymerase sigma-70 factor (ECF subfamily)
VLIDYNPSEQTGSSAESDFRLPLILDSNEAEREEFAGLPRSIANKAIARAWMAPVAEARDASQIGLEIAKRPPVDEATHPHENELRALMIASLDGDASSYHALLTRLTGHLRAYYRHRFARIGHGPTEAEDLLQEVLIALHNHRHTYDRSQPFTPWIHAIARYKFLDYLRRTKSSFKDVPTASVEELTAESDIRAVESGLDLQRLMSKISSKARRVIQFVKLEGLSMREAAARCGMSESAVKVAVHRGLKALALQIREESKV